LYIAFPVLRPDEVSEEFERQAKGKIESGDPGTILLEKGFETCKIRECLAPLDG